MFEELTISSGTYRIYGPHVYVLMEHPPAVGGGTYWRATDIPVNFLKNVLAKR